MSDPSERHTRVLVLNAGSATLKTTILDLPALEPIGSSDESSGRWRPVAVRIALDATIVAVAGRVGGAGTAGSIDVVGHRVVHGGERFTAPDAIDGHTSAAIDGWPTWRRSTIHRRGRDPRGAEATAGCTACRRLRHGLPCHIARGGPAVPGPRRLARTTTGSAGTVSTACRSPGPSDGHGELLDQRRCGHLA